MTPNEIAEQLVTEWQKQDRMPPMAWDFRGFAAAAAEIAAKAEREACAQVCDDKADEWADSAHPSALDQRDCARSIRLRSNAEITGRTLAQNEADGA